MSANKQTNTIPDSNIKYNWLSLTIVQASAFTSVIMLMFGYVLSKNYGLYTAIANIILGNLILMLIALPISIRAYKYKQTSAMQSEEVMGQFGNKLTMLGLVILLMGWFSVELNLTTKTVVGIMYESATPFHNKLIDCLVGGFITFIVLYGLKKMKKLIQFSCIVSVFTVSTIFLYAKAKLQFIRPEPIDWSSLINSQAYLLVVSGFFGTTFDAPTFYRLSASKRDCTISIVLVFWVCFSFVEVCGALLYQYLGKATIVDALISQELGKVLRVWNAIFMMLSMCALNSTNLYGSAVNSNILFGKIKFTHRAIILGVIGMIIACTNPADNFISLLDKALIIVASILPLMVLKATIFPIMHTRFSNIAAVVGVLVGFTTAFLPIKFAYMSSFAYVNAGISSILVYVILFVVSKIYIRLN